MLSPTLLELQLQNALKIRHYFPSKSNKLKNPSKVMEALRICQDLETLCWYLPHISFYVDHEDKMAKQTSDYTLIDYRLSEDELNAFDKWLEKEAPTPTAVLIELASKDYKVSLSYVENSEAWCVSITGKENAKFNAKCTLTTWDEDPMEALYMAAYKTIIVFSGGKWNTKQQSKRG